MLASQVFHSTAMIENGLTIAWAWYLSGFYNPVTDSDWRGLNRYEWYSAACVDKQHQHYSWVQ